MKTLLPLLALVVCAAQQSAAQSIDTLAIRANTRFLSSDLLEGRGTGTRGEHIAASYIAAQLARIGARPAAGSDYFLRLPLKRAVIDDDATAIRFNNNTYRSVRDFVWNTGGRGAFHDFSGPLFFVGKPDTTAVRRAAETRGKVVVLIGPMGAAAETYVPALIDAGATGVVLLIGEQPTFDLYVRSRGEARYFADAQVNDPVWQPDLPVVIAGPALSQAIAASGDLKPFTPLQGTLNATIATTIEDVESANVAGVIEGSDPKLATEYVAYSAHYDHLGISTPDANGDSIYNGFSDNAAGVAMVIAIGDVFHQQRPARSVLLLFFTGEERGLLGSSYYVSQPAIPLRQMAALINLDAGAPPAPPVEWRIAGGDASPLGIATQQALAAHHWKAELSGASPNSDYWPFLKKGVPAVFIIPGNSWQDVTAEEQKQLRTKWDHYHQAADEWHADFPFSGLQRYAEAALIVGRAMASSAAAR